MQRIFLFIMLLAIAGASSAMAQNVTIKGKVIADDDDFPLTGATIKLNPVDTLNKSIKPVVTTADLEGNFTIVSRAKEKTLTISFIGYADTTINIPQGKTFIDLKEIKMKTRDLALGELVVQMNAMSTIKGDTVEYHASSFKTNPDATVEDLVNKMPGITSDSDGSISAHGETVKKILLDGKEYFKDDPSFALKSLNSDLVSKIEVFDDKSDDAKFSGFDDGERIKTLNIVTKEGVKGKVMGDLYAGYGTKDRYIGGGRLTSIQESSTLNLIAQINKIGPLAFGFAEPSGGMMYRGRGMMSSDNSSSQYETSAFSPLNRRSMIALNYSKEIKDKLKLNINYMFGNTRGESARSSTQRFLTSDRYTESTNGATSITNMHTFYARAEWTPTEKHKITFTPSISYSLNRGDSYNTSSTLMGEAPLNNAENNYRRRYQTFSGNVGLYWQHSLNKPGRVITIGGDIGGNRGMGKRSQISEILQNRDSTDIFDRIDQLGRLNSSGYYLRGSATFAEPIGKHSQLAVNYNINFDRSFADQIGYDYNDITGLYDIIDEATTNNINRNYTTHTAGLGYTYSKDKKITLNINMDYLFASQNSKQHLYNQPRIKSKTSFNALQPRISLRLNPKFGHNLNFRLTRYASFPSMLQMQDVLDVTDPLRVSKGNPNLAESYSTRFMTHYNYANVEKNIFFSIMGFATQTSDMAVSHRQFLEADTNINGTILEKGTEYTTYENLNGYWSARLFSNFSIAINPIKSNLNFNVSYGFSRQPSIQDNVKYVSYSNSIGGGLFLTSNISEKIDFTLGYRLSMDFNRAGTGAKDKFYTHRTIGKFNIFLTENLFLNADISWVKNHGTQEGYAQDYALLNGAIGYKFLSKKQAEFRLQIYDALNQNKSFRQSLTDTYITTNTTHSILKRFLLLSFTYKFGKQQPSEGRTMGHGMMRHGPRR